MRKNYKYIKDIINILENNIDYEDWDDESEETQLAQRIYVCIVELKNIYQKSKEFDESK